jgi:hypothetical protein
MGEKDDRLKPVLLLGQFLELREGGLDRRGVLGVVELLAGFLARLAALVGRR